MDNNRKKYAAFTLAEVLITLGVIGIVAALTIPNLMGAYRKRVVETRLKKFYSAINQAITLSENTNGDKKDWAPKDTDEFWEVYLKPYLNYTNAEDYFNTATHKMKIVYFADGSAVMVDIYYAANADGEVTWQTTGGHFIFCPEAKNCRAEHLKDSESGVKKFYFAFWPNEISRASAFAYHKGKGVEPYMAWWDGKEESLYTNKSYGCNNHGMYCAAIIQRNGWKIPDDYPFKF